MRAFIQTGDWWMTVMADAVNKNRAPSVYIVSHRIKKINNDVSRMFTARGWDITDVFEDADLIQFQGGIDINPELYGENPIEGITFDLTRDEFEKGIYEQARKGNKMMAGICRGGQFLNVMNGGKLFQDVDGHTGPHRAWLLDSKGVSSELIVTSTHHQMIIPTLEAEILMFAAEGKSKRTANGIVEGGFDYESVYYSETNSLCFQPHPEMFSATIQCQDTYFKFIEEKFGLKG